MNTLLLNPETWDLMIASSRDIAMATEPYALAQDAASAIKLFQGEDYYDTTRGVPYWAEILGKWPTVQIMQEKFVVAAKTVPGVTAAVCYIDSILDRRPKGQVQITNEAGATSVVGF